MRSVAFSSGGKASKLPAPHAVAHAHAFCKTVHVAAGPDVRRQIVACAAGCLSAAEVSRTITALVNYGTLSTVNDDGLPLGTYVTFVLDPQGCPVLRLRADAVHTANLQSNPSCTLFAHPAERPARELARVTLIGAVEPVSEEDAAEAAARHAIIYGACIGVDAPQADDVFMRLKVQECFYVAGLGVRGHPDAEIPIPTPRT